MTCRHCGQGGYMRPRGLCHRCYSQPAIREQYPTNRGYHAAGDQTMEELEAIIAEQSRQLPDWWDRETRLEARRRGV